MSEIINIKKGINMKASIICIRIAGIVCAFFTVSHSLFNRMFHWETSLSCLSQLDRAIMLTYHYLIILIIGFMSVVALFQPKQIIESKIGSSVLLLFSVFYLLRIVTEFTLFGFSGSGSIIIVAMCLVPMVLFIVPLFTKRIKQ